MMPNERDKEVANKWSDDIARDEMCWAISAYREELTAPLLKRIEELEAEKKTVPMAFIRDILEEYDTCEGHLLMASIELIAHAHRLVVKES